MAEAPGGRTAKIAIGLAVVSVVVVLVAVIVVIGRGGSKASGTGSAAGPVKAIAIGPEIVVVDARDVVRMDRGTVEPVPDRTGGSTGIKINDPELLETLKLEATDVITAISGKPVRRQFDVYDALLGASMMNATTLYVEMVRGGAPVLVKWELEGDLREARTGQVGRTTRLPAVPLAPDPLVDTIKRVTDLEYEVPRETLEQIGTNAMTGATLGLRAVPSVRNGVIEGVKLYAVRPGSVWAALGLKNGDTVLTVNGRPITIDSMRDDFATLKGESALEATVIRRGNPIALKYSITR